MNAETVLGDGLMLAGRLASMGPRSHERGNEAHTDVPIHNASASMGPRSHERGNEAHTDDRFTTPLQWGRVLMNAET